MTQPVLNAPPDQAPAMYQQSRAQAIAAGIDPKKIPEQYDPNWVRQAAQAGIDADKQVDNHHAALTLAQTILERAPDTAKKWSDLAYGQIAATKNQDQLDQAIQVLKSQNAPPAVLAAIPTKWSQEAVTALGAQTITPEQRVTNAGQEATRTETVRHNKESERVSLIRANLESKNRVDTMKARSDLADVVIKNPSLYDELTPTEKGHIAGELAGKGFEGFGKKPSEQAVKQISQTRNALDGLKELRQVLKDNETMIGPVSGLVTMLPYATKHKEVQAKIDAVRQRVGKALEGGVLRKEDEEKYKKILATMQDTPELAISKTDNLINDLDRDMGNYTDELRRSGRNVKPQATKQNAAAPAASGDREGTYDPALGKVVYK